ncbi:hypothetical protein P3T35_008126 [Kitasatospora sp. GP30]|nr:hypothetical protein [Kitasatospora sp. GP30]
MVGIFAVKLGVLAHSVRLADWEGVPGPGPASVCTTRVDPSPVSGRQHILSPLGRPRNLTTNPRRTARLMVYTSHNGLNLLGRSGIPLQARQCVRTAAEATVTLYQKSPARTSWQNLHSPPEHHRQNASCFDCVTTGIPPHHPSANRPRAPVDGLMQNPGTTLISELPNMQKSHHPGMEKPHRPGLPSRPSNCRPRVCAAGGTGGGLARWRGCGRRVEGFFSCWMGRRFVAVHRRARRVLGSVAVSGRWEVPAVSVLLDQSRRQRSRTRRSGCGVCLRLTACRASSGGSGGWRGRRLRRRCAGPRFPGSIPPGGFSGVCGIGAGG